MTNFKIHLISSSILNEDIINEFKDQLPNTIEVRPLYNGKFLGINGATTPLIIALITASTDGFFTGVGEYVFKLIVAKIEKLVKKDYSTANFEIDLSEGETKRIFKANNINNETFQKVLTDFKEMVTLPGASNTYVFVNGEWILENHEEIKNYLKKERDDANQRFND